MIGGIVTLAFVVLTLLVGGLLFDTDDWSGGNHTPRR